MNVDERVRQLAKDPALALMAPWAKHADVVEAFFSHCQIVADSNPKEGLPLAKTALRIATDACRQAQALAIRAQCERVMGQHAEAQAHLALAFDTGELCAACPPDLYRRRACAWAAVHEHGRAVEDASEAIRRYEKLGHAGHDLHGNGLATSYFVRGAVLFHSGSYREASNDMGQALALIDGVVSPRLLVPALQNYAACLRKLGAPEDLLRAEKYIRQARRHFRGSTKPSQHRAKLAWTAAMIREEIRKLRPRPPNVRIVRPARIRQLLERARRDLVELGYQDDAAAITADLARIAFPDVDRIPAIIAALDTDLERHGRKLPKKIGAKLERLRRAVATGGLWDGDSDDVAAAFKETRKAIKALRGACGDTIACLISWQPVFGD